MKQEKFNLLILDVDGVIKLPKSKNFEGGWHEPSILRLKSILSHSNTYLILASNWRLFPNMFNELINKLDSYGIEIYGATNDHRYKMSDFRDLCLERWIELRNSEIREFINKNQVINGKLLNKWVCIDDLNLNISSNNFVKTDELEGITERKAWLISNRIDNLPIDLNWSRDGYEIPEWWKEYGYKNLRVGLGCVKELK